VGGGGGGSRDRRAGDEPFRRLILEGAWLRGGVMTVMARRV
jgi:hypothetical protein